MSDVRLTATNPEDSSVVPVACNARGELLLAEDSVGDHVRLDDGGTKQVIKSAGLGLSNGTTERITLNATAGSGTFSGNVNCYRMDAVAGSFAGKLTLTDGDESGVALSVYDKTNATDNIVLNENGNVSISGNVTFGSNPGNINATSYLSSGGNVHFYRKTENPAAALLNVASDIGGTNRVVATIFAGGSAQFVGDVVIGSRGQQWMIVESGGIAHLVSQTLKTEESEYPELRNIPQELTMVEQQLQKVMERLRMIPEAGWEVWDGDNS